MLKSGSSSSYASSSSSVGGGSYGGVPSLPQATATGFVNPNAQKPIRNFFKVPSQGVYRLAEEITFNPPKTQRKLFHPLAATKISFVSTGNSNAELKESGDGTEPGVYMAMNIGESVPLYQLLMLGRPPAPSPREKPPLSFREMPTCHAFNSLSASPSKLELLVGFSSGDILLYESLRKSSSVQFNKEKCLVGGKVTGVAWVPRSKNEFVVSFSTGVLLWMDREREDQQPGGTGGGGGGGGGGSGGGNGSSSSSAKESNDSFCVVRQKNAKFNPVSKWAISSKAVNGIAFSPSGKHIAVASQDGYLRVFDCEEETMLIAFRSYYGGFLCVSWSPDGKYLATGGEDDLVCVWSFHEKCILARGQGHRSFVTEVRFDPWACGVGPNSSTYRIASVAEDTRLLLWDFERELLRRPRNISMSFSSRKLADLKVSLSQVQSQSNMLPLPSSIHHPSSDQYKAPIVESLGRNEVPQMHPLVEHRTHHEPVSDVHFLEHFLVTCSWGKVKFWSRPDANTTTTSTSSEHPPPTLPPTSHALPVSTSPAPVPPLSSSSTASSTPPSSRSAASTPSSFAPPPIATRASGTPTTTSLPPTQTH